MATPKTALSEKSSSGTPKLLRNEEKAGLHQSIYHRIAERAYALFESSGRKHGHDAEHWLRAESEILHRGLEIRESGSWLSVNAYLPDVSAEDVQVLLEPDRVVIHTEKNKSKQNTKSETSETSREEVFLVEDLATEVEPETATASFRDHKLSLMVKKRYPLSAPADQQAATTK
jgi:HSP20 family molecular chaperone IbpA